MTTTTPYFPQPRYKAPAVADIPSHLAWAIISTILLFWPTGIVAIVNAATVSSRLAAGDVAGAQLASRKAARWAAITTITGVALIVLFIVIVVTGASLATARLQG